MSLTSPGAPSASHPEFPDVPQLSYEQAREELVSVVQRLESGQVPLEEAMSLWERGEALAAHCQSWLDQARARLEALSSAPSNVPPSA